MTAEELIDRLIEDINASIEIRGRVGSLQVQMMNALNGSIQDFVSSLNIMEFDSHTDIIIQFLGNRYLSHQHGQVLDINALLAELIANKTEIIAQVQYILDGNLISVSGESVSDLLQEQFEWVHKAAR